MPNPPRNQISQTESGKAFEYGIARSFAEQLGVELHSDRSHTFERRAYERLDRNEQRKIDKAAGEAVEFLLENDDRLLDNPIAIRMQSDMRGQQGDSRDIIIQTASEEIGISAKHRHDALKHPRLAPRRDFMEAWTGQNCTPEYWQAVGKIFDYIQKNLDAGVDKWRDLPDKKGKVYAPMLAAFMDEIERQYNKNGADFIAKLLEYMIGTYDFYRVMKENGNVILESFNMKGSLRWGNQLPTPSLLHDKSISPKSSATAILTFDQGWALSFRLHSAESKLVPSLKFDVRMTGQPTKRQTHTISYVQQGRARVSAADAEEFFTKPIFDKLLEEQKEAAIDALGIFRFRGKSRGETNFAPVFNDLLGPFDEACKALVLKLLQDSVPTGQVERQSWFEPHYGSINRKTRKRYEEMAMNLKKTLIHGKPRSVIGLLRSCLEIAANRPKNVGGVFSAVREKFAFPGSGDLLKRINSVNKFRNTYIAHIEKRLTDKDKAEKNLKFWIETLTLLQT